MNKKKEKNRYADLSIKPIAKIKKQNEEPRAHKTEGGDLRTKGGK